MLVLSGVVGTLAVGLTLAWISANPPAHSCAGQQCPSLGSYGPAPDVVIHSGNLGLKGPAAIAVIGGELLVANYTGDSVMQLGLPPAHRSWSSGRVVAPGAVAVGHKVLWIASPTDNSLTKMKSTNGRIIRTIRGHKWLAMPKALVLVGNRLWVANAASNSLAQLNARTGRLIRVFRSSKYHFRNPCALAVSNGQLWVANTGNGFVTEMNAVTGALTKTLPADEFGFSQPVSEVASSTTLWVGNKRTGSISAINTMTGEPDKVRFRYDGHRLKDPAAMALTQGYLWVTSAGSDAVAEFNIRTGSMRRYLTGRQYKFKDPVGIAAYNNRVWVTNLAGNSVTELVLTRP